jgi:hypothetical protein
VPPRRAHGRTEAGLIRTCKFAIHWELVNMQRSMSILAAAVALALTAQAACASDVQVKVPSTPQAARAADLIARAQRALIGTDEHIQTLWIYPTGEANTVFVHYSTLAVGENQASEHLAFVEMRGARIAKLQDLTSAPPAMVAGTKARSGNPATARVSPAKSGS